MTTAILRTGGPRVTSGVEDGAAMFVAARNNNASSRVASTPLDEDKIPDGVYRQFAKPEGECSAPVAPADLETGGRTIAPVLQTHALEPTVSDLVHLALARTGYPLHHIRCWNDDNALELSGYVTCYFYVQIALEIAMQLANGRRIVAHIEVVPTPDRDQSDD